jgi:hypothetical protein
VCKLASFIVTRERVLWHLESDSHEKIIERYRLDDNKKCDFIRIELVPPGENYLLPLTEWAYRTDQQEVPSWYSAKESEVAVRAEILKWRKRRQWFFDAMDFVQTIPKTTWFAKKKKPLKAWKVFDSRDAARDAARNAAGDAALLSRCIVVADKLDPKFMKHARARWAVWKSGYGLVCDVNGVLYVYRKP